MDHPHSGQLAPDAFDDLADARARRLRAVADEAIAIAHACDRHHIDESAMAAGVKRLVSPGADGTPEVGEFLALEVAGILHISPASAALRLADVLNVRDRHPELWIAAVRDLTIEFWQAARVAAECASAGLDAEAARWVDHQLALHASLMPWSRALGYLKGLIAKVDPALAAERAARTRAEHRVWFGDVQDGSTELYARLHARDGLLLDGMVDKLAGLLAARGDHDTRQQRRAKALGILATPGYATWLLAQTDAPIEPDTQDALDVPTADRVTVDLTGVDPNRLLPRTVLHVHVSDETVLTGCGIARSEKAGPLTIDLLREFLANTRVRVQPVLDRDQLPAVDAYEVPDRLREGVLARHGVEAFPWSNTRSRGCDLDHTVPYDHAAPPGARQTRDDNLAPLARRSHRGKTHGGWRPTHLLPGVLHWRSPAGFHYIVTPSGTIPLGRERPTRGTPAAA